MSDIAVRDDRNPLLTPRDLKPGREGWEIVGVLNPGVFVFEGKVGLVLRVAERPPQSQGAITIAYRVGGERSESGVCLRSFDLDDPLLDATDPRVITYDGVTYLTSISDLRLAWSYDGRVFSVEPTPAIEAGAGSEAYGLEDARITRIDDSYHLTYSAVGPAGVSVGHATTTDWRQFTRHGSILPPPNKDVTMFPGTVSGVYRLLHRPSDPEFGGINMWIAESPDLEHWGNHRFLAAPRPGLWDSVRIGAGGPPIKTDEGWIVIYHGADEPNRYCFGAMLLDLKEPSIMRARSSEPIMEPQESYERVGFFGECVFTNGQVVHEEEVVLYYGASDTVVCRATVSMSDIFDSLE